MRGILQVAASEKTDDLRVINSLQVAHIARCNSSFS